MTLIRNSNQVKQTIDFIGIQNGKIHPSDIDAVLEFNNEALILMEVKREGNDMPIGQRLLLERICDSWHTEKSIVLFVNHSFKNDTKDIPLVECYVSKAYSKGKWTSVQPELLTSVLNKIGINWDIKKLSI